MFGIQFDGADASMGCMLNDDGSFVIPAEYMADFEDSGTFQLIIYPATSVTLGGRDFQIATSFHASSFPYTTVRQ